MYRQISTFSAGVVYTHINYNCTFTAVVFTPDCTCQPRKLTILIHYYCYEWPALTLELELENEIEVGQTNKPAHNPLSLLFLLPPVALP